MYTQAGEIRVLSCKQQREANLFKATTTNFNKQNSKLKPQHIVDTKVMLSQQGIS